MRQLRTVVVSAALAAGCVPAEPPPAELAGGAPTRVVATFTGEADVAAGTLVVTSLDASSGQALQDIPVVRDGVPGVGPDDTVELVTEGAATVAGGCGAVDAFEGRIRLRSFYVSSCLRNAHAEILQLVPSGREACNSAPAVPGVSSALGLFSYGTLAKKGLAGSSASAVWRFKLPDATAFTFRGRIVADVVPECTSPGLPGAPAVALPRAPAGVAAGDLAGDALPDLATVTSAAGSAFLDVAAGAGGGRFSAPSSTALGSTFTSPVRTALANVKGSAALDLLYTDGSGNLVVHENLGGGAFGAASAYAVAGAAALATADLDGDGDLDVAVAGTGVTAFLNAGGAFTPYVAAGATSSGRSVMIVDVDLGRHPRHRHRRRAEPRPHPAEDPGRVRVHERGLRDRADCGRGAARRRGDRPRAPGSCLRRELRQLLPGPLPREQAGEGAPLRRRLPPARLPPRANHRSRPRRRRHGRFSRWRATAPWRCS